jgi:hypothetical protein
MLPGCHPVSQHGGALGLQSLQGVNRQRQGVAFDAGLESVAQRPGNGLPSSPFRRSGALSADLGAELGVRVAGLMSLQTGYATADLRWILTSSDQPIEPNPCKDSAGP